MTVTTSRNKTYNVIFADGPTRIAGTLMLRMTDPRPILEVGAEFDGIEWLKRTSENQGDKEWNGYNKLVSIRRMTDTDVMIELGRP